MSKQDVIAMLEKMPDEAMFDDDFLIEAIYTAYLKAGIKAGLSDIRAGRVLSQGQVEAMFRV